jgi:hypothetical protein
VRAYADAGLNMSKNPYKDGKRSYHNCYGQNPYSDAFKRSEWQRGYDEAEEADDAERNAQISRWNDLWNVPERAKDAYIAMEDDFCPQRVLDFMIAMYPEASE